MTYKKIIRMCNERKDKLQYLMDDNTVNINNERKLQLKGAVDEIQLFIGLLEQYQEKTLEELSGIDNIRGIEQKGFFGKLKDSVF